MTNGAWQGGGPQPPGQGYGAPQPMGQPPMPGAPMTPGTPIGQVPPPMAPEFPAGVRVATVGEVFGNYGLALKRSLKGIGPAYVLFSLASLFFVSGPQQAMQAYRMHSVAGGDLSALGSAGWMNLVNMLVLGFSLTIMTAQICLSAGVRRALTATETPEPAGAMGPYRSQSQVSAVDVGIGEALRFAFSRFWSVLANVLLVGIAVAIGTLFCVLPGIGALFVLMLAPYLVAAGGSDAWGALKRSVQMSTRGILPLLVLVGIIIVFGGVAAGIGVAIRSLAFTIGIWGTFGIQMGFALLMIPVGFFLWLFTVTTFVTVETADVGQGVVS